MTMSISLNQFQTAKRIGQILIAECRHAQHNIIKYQIANQTANGQEFNAVIKNADQRWATEV